MFLKVVPGCCVPEPLLFEKNRLPSCFFPEKRRLPVFFSPGPFLCVRLTGAAPWPFRFHLCAIRVTGRYQSMFLKNEGILSFFKLCRNTVVEKFFTSQCITRAPHMKTLVSQGERKHRRSGGIAKRPVITGNFFILLCGKPFAPRRAETPRICFVTGQVKR